MRVLIACEESQAVCKEFRRLGHEAYSCDTQECSGGHPEWHIQGDVLEQLDKGWDLMIAHPPCTYLAVSGARWLYNKDGTKNTARWENMYSGLDFVKKLMDAPIPRIVIENPISVISSYIRKPDQIIRPYEFGDNSTKSTCLWLKNVPKLKPTNIITPTKHITKSGKVYDRWWFESSLISDLKERAKFRSKTFPGIARAMAEQWGSLDS